MVSCGSRRSGEWFEVQESPCGKQMVSVRATIGCHRLELLDVQGPVNSAGAACTSRCPHRDGGLCRVHGGAAAANSARHSAVASLSSIGESGPSLGTKTSHTGEGMCSVANSGTPSRQSTPTGTGFGHGPRSPAGANIGLPEIETPTHLVRLPVTGSGAGSVGALSGTHVSGSSDPAESVNTVHGKVAAAVKEMQGALQAELHEDHLQLFRRLASGGFGTVYHGAIFIVSCSHAGGCEWAMRVP